MFPLRIRGNNTKFSGTGLPDMAVRVDSQGIHYTAWEPTAEEITKIQNGGRVIVACLGTQPYMVVRAVETDVVYEDYLTPYKPFVDDGQKEWEYIEKAKADYLLEESDKPAPKKRGRPRKVKKEI